MVTLFPTEQRATVCVSSQIGCGVGCIFCATGTMGLKRNLSYLEIVEQVYLARRLAMQSGRHLRNVVFMGMGEPLHNLPEVIEAIRWILSDVGFGISQRCVTVSTSGGNSAMIALAREFPSLRLAVSLHAADQDLRRRLMPRAPNDLDALKETIREINALQQTASLQKNAPVWLEVVLLAGINDSESHARQLIEFCEGLAVEVNLIPYNPIQSDERLVTTDNTVHKRFANQLRSAGIVTTIRQSLGGQDGAACGQLVVKNG
ncbi:MAG: radical SAM protein [Pirellula sp.]